VQYLDAITRVWGDWALFQRLLTVLRRVGDRHGGASIANIAVRWVLDHPFVGAVLVGTSAFPPSQSQSPKHIADVLFFLFPLFSDLFFLPRMNDNRANPRYDLIPRIYARPLISKLQQQGTRLGVSEHPEDNLNVFRFRLSDVDRTDIEAILGRSNGRKMITLIGDCGAEYR
jgi:hypothetical protein